MILWTPPTLAGPRDFDMETALGRDRLARGSEHWAQSSYPKPFMKNKLLAVLLVALGSFLAAFAALFVAISFGTFNLDPDEPKGSRLGDVAALAVGVSVFFGFSLTSVNLWLRTPKSGRRT